MKVICFLDIDDVLCLNNPYGGFDVIKAFRQGADLPRFTDLWAGLFSAEASRNLRSVDQEFAPTYVISSSWTEHLAKPQLVSVFRRTGLEFVVARLHKKWKTPKKAQQGMRNRTLEISSWLKYYREGGEHVLVLDDFESGTGLTKLAGDLAGRRTVILCDVDVGFVDSKLAEAQAALRAAAASPPKRAKPPDSTDPA